MLLRRLYYWLPIGACIWPIQVLICFLIGYNMLGHWPRSGIDPDPHALDIVHITTSLTGLFVLSYLTLPCWPIIAIIVWGNFGANKNRDLYRY